MHRGRHGKGNVRAQKLRARLRELRQAQAQLGGMSRPIPADEPDYIAPERDRFRPQDIDTTPISIRFPTDLFNELNNIKATEGINVSFQIIKATREYLAKRRVKQQTGGKTYG